MDPVVKKITQDAVKERQKELGATIEGSTSQVDEEMVQVPVDSELLSSGVYQRRDKREGHADSQGELMWNVTASVDSKTEEVQQESGASMGQVPQIMEVLHAVQTG